MQWSAKPPTCSKCPPCFAGTNCDRPTRYRDVQGKLGTVLPVSILPPTTVRTCYFFETYCFKDTIFFKS